MAAKTIIMTGADGALGQVVAAKLLNEGLIIYASVFDEKNKKTLEELFPKHLQKTIFPIIANLSEEKDVKNLVASAGDSIFGLVHLAGGYKEGKSLSDYKTDDFQYLMDLNAKPAFLLLKELIPMMKTAKKGSIVTIGARPVLHPLKENILYTSSKSALVALTLGIAEECRAYNIRANVILPATLQTPNNLSWATEDQFNTFTPLSDVADTIAYLMSENSKGITGVSIPMYNKIPW